MKIWVDTKVDDGNTIDGYLKTMILAASQEPKEIRIVDIDALEVRLCTDL